MLEILSRVYCLVIGSTVAKLSRVMNSITRDDVSSIFTRHKPTNTRIAFLVLHWGIYTPTLGNRNLHFKSLNFLYKLYINSISHLCFADDLFVFTRGDIQSVEALKRALALFRLKSGLEPSLEKSEVFFGNVDDHIKEAILQSLPFRNGVFPIRYLGVPLSPVRLRNADFLGVIQKIRNRIHNWKCKFLSYGGRRQLIASVLQSLQLYWMSVFAFPVGVLHTIEGLCRNFLWAQGADAKGRCRIAWNEVCKPVLEGGLGFRRLVIWNRAFLAKHLWEILEKRNSLWIAWVNQHCLRGKSIWEVTIRTDWSWTFRSILSIRSSMQSHVFSKIGNGVSINAWSDFWLDCGTLKAILPFRSFSGEGFSRASCVADVLNQIGGGWPNAWIVRAPVLQNQNIPTLSDAQDVIVWKNDQVLGDFSITDAYYTFLGHNTHVPWSKVVWVKGYIPKHALCVWMAILNRLPTQDRLISWKHIPPDSKCFFCNACVETHEHLFCNCVVLADLWRMVRLEVDLSNGPMDISHVHDDLLWNDMQKLAFSATVYMVWRERNARLFRKIIKPMETLFKEIQMVVIARMAWKNRRSLNVRNEE
ncbi:hypothetical protein OSB04_011635 [Centaurea solstitialis]|uniref:Reverse transcriptase zinc-binding domain-containing protein n=1 Tax=Centaurea solstitialis TaxID=347529 RepID=A0AA38TKJ0_9ASTR|nr:hypothetical protein OSB04_011635 [Centaurea solstitialis]